MTKEVILVSSGFVLPSNRLFSVVNKDFTYRDSLLNKKANTGKDVTLTELISAGALSSSSACNQLYSAYMHDNSVDNYLNLVDAVTEVFKNTSFKEFIFNQARNSYLSPLGFKLCLDLVSDKLHKTYRDYLASSSFFKLNKPTDTTTDQLNRRMSEVSKFFTNNYEPTFLNVLSVMMEDKGALVAFFQYVLTDSNRGDIYE